LLCTVSLALLLLSIVLIVLGRSAQFPPSPAEWTAASWTEQLARVVGLLGAPILGALIAAHHPGNRYGWLWCTIGLASAIQSVTTAYAIYALLVVPGGLPGGLAAAWLSGTVSYVAQGLLPFVFLLFPDGRLPSPGWRPAGWATGLAVAGLCLGAALGPGPLESFPFWNNPVGMAQFARIGDTLGYLAWFTFFAALVVVGPAAVLIGLDGVHFRPGPLVVNPRV